MRTTAVSQRTIVFKRGCATFRRATRTMRRPRLSHAVSKLIALMMVLCLVVPTVARSNDAPETSLNEWEFGAEVYGWGANLGGKTVDGAPIKLDFGDIVDDLNFGFMGILEAKRDRLIIFGDFIYLNLDDSGDASIDLGFGPEDVSVKVELKGFISTVGVAYEVVRTPTSWHSVLGGARYLWLDNEVKVREGSSGISSDDSNSSWDAIVGLTGRIGLNDKWYLSYYGDVGAGDSDFTWQARAAVNYRFEKFDLSLGYRYLDWDLGSDFEPADDLNVKGVYVGAKFDF